MKKKIINALILNTTAVLLFGLVSCGNKADTATNTSETTVSDVTSDATIEETSEENHSVTVEVFLEEYYKVFDTAMKKDFSYDGKKTTNSSEETYGTYDCDTNLFVYEDDTHYSLFNIKDDGLVYDYKKLVPEFETIRDVVLNYVAYNKYIVLYATSDAKCSINGDEYKIVNGNDSITLTLTETGLTLFGNNSNESLSFDMTVTYGNVDTTLL